MNSVGIKKRGSLPTAVVASAVIQLTMLGSASAATVTVDGVMTSGEYAGGVAQGTQSLLWFNDHNSIYTKAAGNMNPLNWEINGSGANWSLNLFFEVPTYARRMIWLNGCTYDQSPDESDCESIPTEYLDAYFAGSHHSDVKMDYNTQTGSEYFRLNAIDDSELVKIKWQDEDDNGLDDGFTWATSREYLIGEGICTAAQCLQFDWTSSIELMWIGFISQQATLDFLNDIGNMQLHLSDEARGLPEVQEVPLPAALPLFGVGLLGFFGITGRRGKKRQTD